MPHTITLQELISALELLPPSTPLNPPLSRFHSWRGNYSDLSIGQDRPHYETVGHLLNGAKAAVGEVFQAYKGGAYYRMTSVTAVWGDNWGCYTERRVVGVLLTGNGYATLYTSGRD